MYLAYRQASSSSSISQALFIQPIDNRWTKRNAKRTRTVFSGEKRRLSFDLFGAVAENVTAEHQRLAVSDCSDNNRK